MAKNPQTPPRDDAEQRQSRKEILIARKHERQLRNVRIAAVVVVALIVIVVAVALINELALTPNRAVATVGDRSIILRDWQQRVIYERAQRIIYLENQLEAFGGDVGIVQQFGGSLINELLDDEGLGENVLNVMAEELVICDAAAERGIEITDADVQNEINSNFGFYGEGVSPTAQPEPTQTIQPTPSLTPIAPADATAVPTETPEPTATAGPSPTPFPTATPLSEAAFQEQFGGIMTSLTDLGASEAAYRNVVRAQLCRTRLADALAEEQSLSRTALQASIFVITADTEEAANEVQAQIEADGYLTAWNTIQSRIDDPEATEAPPTSSFELLWRTQDSLAASVGASVAALAFDLPVDEPSDVIAVDNGDDTTTYYLIMVSGREERELSESEYQTRQEELLQTFADEQLTGTLQLNELWRSRVPTLPVLDSKFLAAPTATPELEATEAVIPTIAVEEPTVAPEPTTTE